jgi:hypothetical protein
MRKLAYKNSMKKAHIFYVCILITLVKLPAISQEMGEKYEKFPSYFGLQFGTVIPSSFVGSPVTSLTNNEFSTQLSQNIGYTFGATVRAGLSKRFAFETGMNFVQRSFNMTMAVADSNVFATNEMRFISYDIPANVLVYIQLSKSLYMNASMGFSLVFKPTSIGVLTAPGSYHSFRHTGRVNRKGGLDLQASMGFEYRTEKKGFFYFGGSARVPLKPLFDLIATYKYQGYSNTIYAQVDGSFLSLDIKYFLPTIKNRGPQFQRGPIL